MKTMEEQSKHTVIFPIKKLL